MGKPGDCNVPDNGYVASDGDDVNNAAKISNRLAQAYRHRTSLPLAGTFSYSFALGK
ncbi:MAG: hypothetical protein J2P55_06180 [Rhizobiales bacterium]|nr:hypothetical protein [Hyphomicrobiales bacterium]